MFKSFRDKHLYCIIAGLFVCDWLKPGRLMQVIRFYCYVLLLKRYASLGGKQEVDILKQVVGGGSWSNLKLNPYVFNHSITNLSISSLISYFLFLKSIILLFMTFILFLRRNPRLKTYGFLYWNSIA